MEGFTSNLSKEEIHEWYEKVKKTFDENLDIDITGKSMYDVLVEVSEKWESEKSES